MSTSKSLNLSKREKVLLLVEFYRQHGREVKIREEYKGVKLGIFLINIRQDRVKLPNEERTLLESIGYSLKSIPRSKSVHEKVLLLVEFYKKYERPPKAGEEYKGVRIGDFFSRVQQNIVKLTNEDRALLESISYRQKSIQSRERVHKKVLLLVEFYNEYGRSPKQSEEYKGVKLGHFFSSIRQNHVKPTNEDRNLLESIGYSLKSIPKGEGVHKKVLLLVEFYKKYGRAPKVGEEYKEVRLGNFVSNLQRRDTRLSNEDSALLESVGYRLKSISQRERVHKKVLLLVEFYNEYGKLAKSNEEYKGVKIGQFILSIRRNLVKLTNEERTLLESIGYRLKSIPKRESVHKKVLLLVEFYNEYGRTPKAGEEYKEVRIGDFLSRVRQGNTKLTNEDQELLKNLGIRVTKK